MNVPTIRLAIALCGLAAALPATASEVKGQLTPDLIYNHCRTAGVGSQTEGTFMLPGGRVTGTVLCTDADLAAANVPQTYRGHDDDDNHRGRHHDDDDGHDRDDDEREGGDDD